MLRRASKRNQGKPKGGLRPWTFLGVTAAVLWGSYLIYGRFGVADAEGWFQDVLTIVVGIVVLAAAAALVAAFLIAFRKNRKRGNFF